MEQLLKYLQLIWLARITKTEFKSLPISQTVSEGIPLSTAGGKCKAVVLKFNTFARNDTAGLAVVPTYCYYGDSQAQDRELLRGVSSDIIFCDDLSEVFVRNPFAADITIQYLIYK